MVQTGIQLEGGVVVTFQKCLITGEIHRRRCLEILFPLQNQQRLSGQLQKTGCRVFAHLLEIIKGGTTGKLALFGLLVGEIIQPGKGLFELFDLKVCNPLQQLVQTAHGLLVLPQDDVLQLIGGTCHQNQTAVIAALGINTRCQHGAHAVSHDKDAVAVDAPILPQQLGGANGVLNGFFLDGDVLFLQHFSAVGKGTLVVTHGGDAVCCQPLCQILEGGQLAHLFVPVAGTRTVDKHHGGHRFACIIRQGQQTMQRIIRSFSNDDIFSFHRFSPF